MRHFWRMETRLLMFARTATRQLVQAITRVSLLCLRRAARRMLMAQQLIRRDRPQDGRELHARKTHRQRQFWKGLSGIPQAEQWLQGTHGVGPLAGIGEIADCMQVVLKSAKKDDANLAREIHHNRQFIHPHIARLYEVIVTEELVWLVLEYCQGTAHGML